MRIELGANLVARCPACGHGVDFRRRSRPVIQADGELVEHVGNVFNRRRVENRPDTAQLWERVYWRARRSGTMTFSQARGLFFQEHGYFPPRGIPLMPSNDRDWYRVVKNVAHSDLVPRADFQGNG
jgi:hypothetical protein